MFESHFEGADFQYAHIAFFGQSAPAYLSQANLNSTHFEGAKLGGEYGGAHLENAEFLFTHLEGAVLQKAHLEESDLSQSYLEGADLREAHLEGAILGQIREHDAPKARLGGKLVSQEDLGRIRRWVKGFPDLLPPADLRGAFFDSATHLTGVTLGDAKSGFIRMAGLHWSETDLSVVQWISMPMCGDEQVARQQKASDGATKNVAVRLSEFETATRAYRQLSTALRAQGIIEPSDRFTYRALLMQRKALWWQMRSLLLRPPSPEPEDWQEDEHSQATGTQRRFVQQNWQRLARVLSIMRLVGPYLFSWFLAILTGYGYRMSRIVIAYLLLISGFATAYWSVGKDHPRDISFWTAIIVSVTAFHGRVFTNPFTPNIPDTQVVITAIEAIVGLVIEGVFIAMLTQRFFNR